MCESCRLSIRFADSFAFITAQGHVCTEVILNHNTLYWRRDKRKTKTKRDGESSPSNKKKAVIKNYKTPIREIPAFLGEKVTQKQRSRKNVFITAVFTGSIPKCIQLQKFNHLIQNYQAKMFNFAHASSRQLSLKL